MAVFRILHPTFKILRIYRKRNEDVKCGAQLENHIKITSTALLTYLLQRIIGTKNHKTWPKEMFSDFREAEKYTKGVIVPGKYIRENTSNGSRKATETQINLKLENAIIN